MRWLVCALTVLLVATPAASAIRKITLQPPARDFGYFLGDVLTAVAVISTDRGTVLDRAALPEPGPVSRQIDIRRVVVADADRQIRELEALDAAGQAVGPGAKRVGVNPVFQTLQTERNQLQAEAASLRARKASLAAELDQVTARRQKLNTLQAPYDDLVRQRDLLAANVKAFLQRQQESQAQQSISSSEGDGNVRVIERALPPTTGSSLRKPVLAVAVLFAAFSALCAGLLRAFLRRGIPSASYAERTLGLPVLASPGFKPARA